MLVPNGTYGTHGYSKYRYFSNCYLCHKFNFKHELKRFSCLVVSLMDSDFFLIIVIIIIIIIIIMETSFIFNHTKITYNYMQFKTKIITRSRLLHH